MAGYNIRCFLFAFAERITPLCAEWYSWHFLRAWASDGGQSSLDRWPLGLGAQSYARCPQWSEGTRNNSHKLNKGHIAQAQCWPHHCRLTLPREERRERGGLQDWKVYFLSASGAPVSQVSHAMWPGCDWSRKRKAPLFQFTVRRQRSPYLSLK